MPLKAVLRYFPLDDDKAMIQILARGILGLFNSLALIYFKNAVSWTCLDAPVDKSSKRTDFIPSAPSVNWFWAFMLVQFHVPFYMSRPLPNFFAFPVTTVALAFVLEANYTSALGLLAFAAIVFRAELAILLATLTLSLLIFKRLSIFKAVKSIAIYTAIGGLLSLAVDSYFWQKPLVIPEIQGFLFNVVNGKSSEWGVEPFGAYFLTHLPKLMGAVARPTGVFVLFGLVPLGFVRDPTGRFNHLRVLGLASVLFVAIYSLQPHKEWRFIVYVVPVFALLAANGVSHVSSLLRPRNTLLLVSFQMSVVTLLAVIAGITAVKTVASSLNYPGGVALAQFHTYVPYIASVNGDPLVVHMDVPVCMTGASRFGQLYDTKTTTGPWVIYDKTEDSESLEEIADSFDYVITALPPDNVTATYATPENMQWTLLDIVQTFHGINTKELKQLVLALKNEPKTFYERGIAGDDEFFLDWALRVITLKDYIYIYERTQVYPWSDV